jgi:hypothetical protein
MTQTLHAAGTQTAMAAGSPACNREPPQATTSAATAAVNRLRTG